jgi:hypothetical protein
MPNQEVFFEQTVGEIRIEVLKSYDEGFALEAFGQMGGDAMTFLATALDLSREDHKNPDTESSDFADEIWEELKQEAREDWNAFSYFVVREVGSGSTQPLYVSPDWPSAEAFAKQRIALIQ